MKFECDKLFVRKKGWLLLLLFALLRLLTAAVQPNYAADYREELYRDAFLRHMSVLEGPLTAEKAAYIDEENRVLRELQTVTRDDWIRAYSRGEITEEELDVQLCLSADGERRREEFAVISERFAQVQQNPERVYFLYANGWVGLLGNEHPDYLLVILLMLLTVPAVCDEYASEMYPLLRTAVNGGARLFAAKAAAALLAAVLAAALMFAAETAYYAAAMGLPGGSFPLQSLPPFAASPYRISIFGAAALSLLNRCIGAVYLTVLLLCLSVLFRRALSAVFLGTAGIVLPYFLCAGSVNRYLLPTPLSFLLSCCWLRGSMPAKPGAQEIITVTPAQYAAVLCASAGIAAVLFLTGMLVFAGVSVHRRRRVSCALLCLLLPLLLTGCAEAPDPVPELSGLCWDQWRPLPESAEIAIAGDYSSGYALRLTDSGETVPLIRDCFAGPGEVRRCSLPFIDGKTVYYLAEYSMYHDAVIALDTEDFSEKTVCETVSSDNLDMRERLFGLGAYLPTPEPQIVHTESFFVHNGQLILSKNGGIFRHDLQSGTQTCIYAGKAENLAVTCGFVYYIDALFNLCRWDPAANRSETLPVGKTRRFYAAENGLYFRDLKDSAFYFTPPDGSRKELLPDFDEDAFLKSRPDL